jgi:putative tryptophan/tyrosine transport system substrate-binding protein
MRRREFIAGLGGAAVWPIAARAQQGDRVRRIGVLMSLGEADPEAKASLSAFTQRLAELGWTDGRNLRIDVRWGSDIDGIRADAVELVSTNPEVLLADLTPTIQELRRLTQAIPIVFVNIGDPAETGVVARLTRPGNTTGFLNMEPSIGGKWLQVLKEIAPSLNRVLVIMGFGNAAHAARLRVIEASASTFGVEVLSSAVRDASEIERAIDAISHEGNAGLIVMPGGPPGKHRKMIFALAARYRLPAIYAYRYFASDGGLVSYGPDDRDIFRRAASYADRILKGEKPGDLPLQGPVKYELVINVKTAKTFGLTIPETLLATADEVIQ